MFKFFGNVFNISSYWIIMTISILLFLGFFIAGVMIGAAGESFTTSFIEWLNGLLNGATIDPDSLPEGLNWIIAIPFFLMSLPWLFFALLTQRSVISNRRTKKISKDE